MSYIFSQWLSYQLLCIGFCFKFPRDQNRFAPFGSHIFHEGNKLRTMFGGSSYKHGSSDGCSFQKRSAHLTFNSCPLSFSQLALANSYIFLILLPSPILQVVIDPQYCAGLAQKPGRDAHNEEGTREGMAGKMVHLTFGE